MISINHEAEVVNTGWKGRFSAYKCRDCCTLLVAFIIKFWHRMCCEIVCHKGALLTFQQLIAQNVEIKNVLSVQNTVA
jgi:hypothetical protein